MRAKLFTSAAVTGLLIAATSFGAIAEEKMPSQDEVIAVVNGKNITLGDLQILLSSKAATGAPVDPSSILNEAISRELIKQAAEKEGLDKSDDFKKAMEVQRTSLLVNALLSEKMQKVDISDEALKKAYDEEMKSAPKQEFKARHILVKTEDEAKKVIDELKNGADFIKLAKEKSTGPSGPNGGDLGWFEPNMMVPEFADAVSMLKKGQITEKPVKTKFGWHVIKLEDTRKVEPPTFESMKEKLRASVANKALQDYIAELHKSAKIELKQPEGTKAAEEKK